MNMHGVAEYATRNERRRLDLSEDVSLVLISIGIVGGVLTSEDYWQKMGWCYPGKPEAPLQSDPSPPAAASERNESEQPH